MIVSMVPTLGLAVQRFSVGYETDVQVKALNLNGETVFTLNIETAVIETANGTATVPAYFLNTIKAEADKNEADEYQQMADYYEGIESLQSDAMERAFI